MFRWCHNEVRPQRVPVPPEGPDTVTPAEVYLHRVRAGLRMWQGWTKAVRAKLNAVIEDAHFPSSAAPVELAA